MKRTLPHKMKWRLAQSENESDSITESKQDEKNSATGITGSTQKDANENFNMRGENARSKEITGVKGRKLEEDTKILLRDIKVLKQDFKKLQQRVEKLESEHHRCSTPAEYFKDPLATDIATQR